MEMCEKCHRVLGHCIYPPPAHLVVHLCAPCARKWQDAATTLIAQYDQPEEIDWNVRYVMWSSKRDGE